MKKWLFPFLFFPCFIWAQNLVPNGSFEKNSGCPNNTGQLDLLDFWFCPQAIHSTDYFSRCSNKVSVPRNDMGYQQPLSDSSYIGLGLFFQNDYREYFAVKLKSPLLKNKTYMLNLYVSLAAMSVYPGTKYSISKKDFGVYFSSDSIVMPQSHGGDPLPYTPQVVAGSTTEQLNDTANWTELTFYYQAQGGEEYIYLGNFNDDNNTTEQIFYLYNQIYSGIAYYYIDDVSLVRVITKDATINQIEKRDSCFALWAQLQNKGIDSLDFAQAPLPYEVVVKQNGNVVQSYIDSIQSNQYNPNNQPLPLDSSMWFPLPALDLSGLQGNYQISVELQWALDEDSTNNQIDSVFNFDLSVGNPQISTDTICFGDVVQLATANYKGAMQWQSSLDQTQWQNLMPGDTLVQNPTQKTFYRLAVCEAVFSDTFEVEVIKPNLTALEENEFCSDKQQSISIKKENSFTTLRWYSDSNSNSFFYEGIDLDTTLKASTVFYLAPVLLGCESKKRIPLTITISCEIKIPNVFTPNGDGINDLFIYRNVDESKELQTKIFNRWGDLIIQWNGNKGWNGEGQTEGVYFYEIHYGGEKITGVVSLIRD